MTCTPASLLAFEIEVERGDIRSCYRGRRSEASPNACLGIGNAFIHTVANGLWCVGVCVSRVYHLNALLSAILDELRPDTTEITVGRMERLWLSLEVI